MNANSAPRGGNEAEMNVEMNHEEAEGGVPGLEEHRGGVEVREDEKDAQAKREFEEIVLDEDGEKKE
jgi:hypothetical protein